MVGYTAKVNFWYVVVNTDLRPIYEEVVELRRDVIVTKFLILKTV